MKSIGGPFTKANIMAPERLKTEPKILACPCICFMEMLSTLKLISTYIKPLIFTKSEQMVIFSFNYLSKTAVMKVMEGTVFVLAAANVAEV